MPGLPREGTATGRKADADVLVPPLPSGHWGVGRISAYYDLERRDCLASGPVSAGSQILARVGALGPDYVRSVFPVGVRRKVLGATYPCTVSCREYFDPGSGPRHEAAMILRSLGRMLR